jgi:hypothetical protein
LHCDFLVNKYIMILKFNKNHNEYTPLSDEELEAAYIAAKVAKYKVH